jgi:hypothetical protein
MRLPNNLKPTSTEDFELPSGRRVSVPKCEPAFQPWHGWDVGDTYNGKQVLDVGGKPAFAELAILWSLRAEGWDGVWVDTYRDALRTGYWNVPPLESLPDRAAALLASIYAKTGSRHGTWDVFCWTGDDVLFAESKRSKKDSIRDTQRTWLEAALAVGLKPENFLVVEWSIAKTDSSSPVS